MYKIAVCDDISSDRDATVEIIKKKANEAGLLGISYFLYNSGKELLENINMRFDVIFLDIQMEHMDGGKTAELIRIKDLDVIIVFESGIRMPTPELFRVQPYRYITKQFVKNKMEFEVKEILDKMVSKQKKYLTAMGNGKCFKINLNDIIYITLVKRGCEIWILGEAQKKYESAKIYSDQSLKCVNELIDDSRFVYAHNSYIINIEHVVKASRTEVVLRDNINLAIARSKSDNLKKQMLAYAKDKYQRKSNI